MRTKRIPAVIAALLLLLCLSACRKGAGGQAPAPAPVSEPTDVRSEAPVRQTGPQTSETQASSAQAAPDEADGDEEMMIYAHIGDDTLKIRPEAHSSAEAFLALLREGDVAVSMHDYGGFEKVGPLGASLPTNDEHITTEPGDVILYQGDQITIYYGTNTWSFTRLGRVQELSQAELKDILGDGGVEVTFSLRADAPSAGGEG